MSSTSADPIVIVSYARTPVGAFQGSLSALSGSELGGIAIKAAVARAGLKGAQINDVLMGCVLSAGVGQAPARQAALNAGLPQSTTAATLNKVCGSGLRSVMTAHDMIHAGSAEVMVAGGMESMSNAPYMLPKARGGFRMGHGEVKDHMFMDGLEDAYGENGTLMGVFADRTAEKYQFTREAQDEYAIESITRAQKAQSAGKFEAEIIPVEIADRKGTLTVTADEGPQNARPEKIPSLRPAFGKDGTVTAANASSINDGAGAVVLMRRSKAEALGVTPVATIIGHATHAQEPAWFTTAPVGAMQKLFAKTGWDEKTTDLFEVNEAFACVTMAAMRDLNLPHEKVNIHGGAVVLGHPIGASGTRVLCTLLSALQQTGGKTGIASLCIGGGEGVALAVEMMS